MIGVHPCVICQPRQEDTVRADRELLHVESCYRRNGRPGASNVSPSLCTRLIIDMSPLSCKTFEVQETIDIPKVSTIILIEEIYVTIFLAV